MAATGVNARKIDAEKPARAPVAEAGIDALMRDIIAKRTADGGGDAAASKDPRTGEMAPRRDFDMATELLDRASQAFDLLIVRCQDLERDLDQANEQAQARAVDQQEAIESWKQVAGKFKAQLETTEQAMASLRARCDAVEARAVKAEAKAKQLEATSVQAAEHAALSERLSTKLHDKVVSAFGIGSRAHPVLEAVATRAAAE